MGGFKNGVRNSKYAKSGLEDLCKWVKKNRDTKKMKIVEIGSFIGESAIIFSKYFKEVYCIDAWTSGYDTPQNDAVADPKQCDMQEIESIFDNVAANHDNIIKVKSWSADAVSRWEDGFFDIVYIDGLHTYQGCKDDILLWFPKVHNDGFIAGHDWQGRFPGVIDAVKEILGEPEAKFNDSSWIFFKKKNKLFN